LKKGDLTAEEVEKITEEEQREGMIFEIGASPEEEKGSYQ
jgi:hypothetical protein